MAQNQEYTVSLESLTNAVALELGEVKAMLDRVQDWFDGKTHFNTGLTFSLHTALLSLERAKTLSYIYARKEHLQEDVDAILSFARAKALSE